MRTIILLASVLLVVGCASSGTTSSTPTPTPGAANSPAAARSGTPTAVAATLCEATEATDVDAARASFASAHDGLHTLARDLQERELRARSARLLEAKQRVEAAVADELPLADLGPRLDDLLAAVSAAADDLDRPSPTCD